MKFLPLHITAQGTVWFLFYMLLVVCFAIWVGYREDKSKRRSVRG